MSELTFIRYFPGRPGQDELVQKANELAEKMGCVRMEEKDATGINESPTVEKRERRYHFNTREEKDAFHKAVGPIYYKAMEQMGAEPKEIKPGDTSTRLNPLF